MATIEPPSDEEEAFRLIMSVDFGKMVDEVPPDYQEYSGAKLLTAFEDARQELADTGEMVFPKSEEAIRLSAVYHGLLGEMKRRGLA